MESEQIKTENEEKEIKKPKIKKISNSEIINIKRVKIDSMESQVHALMDEWRKEKEELDKYEKLDNKATKIIKKQTGIFSIFNRKTDEKLKKVSLKQSVKPIKKALPKPIKKDASTLQKENNKLKTIISAILWGDIIIGVIIIALMIFVFGGIS